MRRLTLRTTAATMLLLSALTGCSIIEPTAASDPPRSDASPAPVEPTPTQPTPAGPSPSASVVDCAGAETSVSGTDLERTIVGTCPVLLVNGDELEIDATGATIDEIRLDGDDNQVDAASLATVSVSGDENEIDAVELGSLDISGDDNSVDVQGALEGVSVAGDSNEVEADRIDAVATTGSGNRIESR